MQIANKVLSLMELNVMADAVTNKSALHKFLQEIFVDVLHLNSDSITFTTGSENIRVVLSKNKVEVKSVGLELQKLRPLLLWLHDHFSPFKTQDPKPQLDESSWNFLATIRVSKHVFSFVVNKMQRLNGSTHINLSQITSTPLSEAIARFGFSNHEQEAFLNLLDSKTGLLLLSSPNQELLNLSMNGFLCLAGFNDIAVINDTPDLKNINHEQLTILTIRDDDPVDALMKYKATGINLRENKLLASLCHALVRRICPSCAREAAIDPSLIAQLPDILRSRLNGKFKIGRGCEQCGHLGYLGKVGIKSFVKNSGTFEDAFLAGQEHSDLISLSYDEGAVSLIEDGIEKVNEGTISLDALYEVIKVIPEACLKHLYKMSKGNASSEKILSIPDDYFFKQSDETQNQKPLVGATALAPNPESIAAALNEPVLQIKTDKKRANPLLLVVEDDPDQRSILEMLFRGAGYDIMSASDGVEAFQQIEKAIPDLIISDLMMPRMDGGQFVKKLKSTDKLMRIPVLMLTVVSDVQKEYELLDLGADDYCEKTIQRKILLKRIENLLKRT